MFWAKWPALWEGLECCCKRGLVCGRVKGTDVWLGERV